MSLFWVNLPAATSAPARLNRLSDTLFSPFSTWFFALLFVALLMASCAASPRFVCTSSGDTVAVLEERIRCQKNQTARREASALPTKGKASFYGDKFHGRKTASGELYDRTLFTAAHRTLPFGTMVTVRNLLNSKTVVVRVNDRGPHKKSRIIDLSYAAAEKVGMLSKGIVPVEIEIIKE